MLNSRIKGSFLRFSLAGIFFTVLGPSLFWIAYPLGAFNAVALAEAGVHTFRFLTFRTLVFPAKHGYRVSLLRYVISALPASLVSFISVASLRGQFNRTELTLVTATLAVVIGFIWSKYVFTRKITE